MRSWQQSMRYRLGHWLVTVGERLIQEASHRELVRRVVERLRDVPKDDHYERRAKDIAAEEMTKFYIEQERTGVAS